MRIIIEIEEGTSAAEPEIRRESRTGETTVEEAIDAGTAPRSEPDPTAGASEERGVPEGATDVGHAPEAMPDPSAVPMPETATQAAEASSSDATDAGGAPGNPGETPREASRPVETSAADGGSAPDLGPDAAAVPEGMAVDYEAIVAGTVEEVKDRVREGGFDVERVIEAEKAGKNRSTLVEWLEKHDSGTEGSG
jgi:hypothetical protein